VGSAHFNRTRRTAPRQGDNGSGSLCSTYHLAEPAGKRGIAEVTDPLQANPPQP
jgi:hypothetical protein